MKMRTRAAALAHGHSVSTLTANTAASRLCLHGPRARGHTRPWLRCHRSEAPARSAPPLVGTPPSCAHTEGGSDRPGFAPDGSHAVYTRSGWFDQETRIAPVSRIQTVDSHRGPLEQLFGLANVTVTTASAAGPLRINGLDRATAEQLVTELTDNTQAEPGDAT